MSGKLLVMKRPGLDAAVDLYQRQIDLCEQSWLVQIDVSKETQNAVPMPLQIFTPMSVSDARDTRPLVMENTTRADSLLPEVVPVESTTKDNTMYNSYSWLERPISASENGSDNPLTSITNPYSQAADESATIGVKGFHKTSRKNFALLVALAVFLFTALALSTGLGIPLAKCRNKFDPDGYAALRPLNVNSVKIDAFCDKNGNLTGNSTYSVTSTFRFDLHCGKKFNQGLPAYDAIARNGIASGTIQNIVAIVSYSVSDCIDACAAMNKIAKAGNSSNPPCQSVTFLAGMGAAVTNYDGNCILKATTVNSLNNAISDNGAVSAEVSRLRSED